MDELKVNHNGIYKRFQFTANYEELITTISQSFSICKDNIVFSYLDDDGDRIVISSEIDYNHIISLSKKTQMRCLRLNLDIKSIDLNKSETLSCINSILPDDTLDHELKSKFKSQLHKEIDLLTENFKNRLMQSIDTKINSSSRDNRPNGENMKCTNCKALIMGSDFVYKCFLCDDVNFCKSCEGLNTMGNHIMIKYNMPDIMHMETLKSLSKKNINTFSYSNFIAFNTYSDKFIIEVIQTEEDYQTFNFKLVNMCKYNLQPGDVFECLFDESDIFGNKVTINDLICKNEDFEINVVFYSFKNKSPGFYISKWNFVLQSSCNEKYCIMFVFFVKKQYVDESMPFQRLRKFSENVLSNASDKSSTNEKQKTLSVPDLYSEIIKKYQQNK
jgi:hypothetical protein